MPLSLSSGAAMGTPVAVIGFIAMITMRAKEEETPMPELLVDFITSLDGYGAAEGRPDCGVER